MKVFLCKVSDPNLGEWVDIGAFSTCAKAMGAGSNYMVDTCGESLELLDWEHDTNIYTDWFSHNNKIFTRVVTEVEVDRPL